MLQNTPFYNSTIRNTTSAFGAIFNDMEITRVHGNKTQTVKVPLTYASADKAFSRRTEDPTLNFNMMQIFPRMSFYLTNLVHDTSRKVTSAQFASKDNTFAFSPAPYNLDFDLYIATANIEDGLQIVEQILPFFNPEFTLSTNAVPSLNLKYDVPIVLNSVSYMDPAQDSDYTDFRIIEWTLSFTAKTYMLGPVRSREEIKHAKLQIFEDLPFGPTHLEDSTADVVPDTANKNDPHRIDEKVTHIK